MVGAAQPAPEQPVSAALDYARRGWPVLPLWWPQNAGCACGAGDCASPGKHPLGTLARHGVLDATTDPTRIARWWARQPLANVGVATGRASGIVVVDVDPRHDGPRHLAQLERQYLDLPRTVEVVSGGGGRHLYFEHRDGPIPSGANLVPGVDLRGDGGYVIAPPSLHASGRRYRWRTTQSPHELALASLPAWLADVARHRDEPSGALRERRLLTPADPVDRLTFRELMAEVGVHPGNREQEMHRCPWHADEHPSLSVHWTAAVFHCFGCEVGGGIGTLRRLVRGERWPW